MTQSRLLAEDSLPHRTRRHRGANVAGVVGLVTVSILGLFSVAQTAALSDGGQYWMMADRLAFTGKPFYLGAVDHKGPLWVGAFRAARAITAHQGLFWFLIAAQVVLFAAIVALGIRHLARLAVGPRPVATVVAVVAYVLMLLGPEHNARSLFGRNITAALTIVAVILVVHALDRSSKRAIGMLAVAGVLFGLCTQTVLTTAAPTAAVALGIVLLSGNRWEGVRRALLFGVCAVAAFATAPIWYATQGVGEDFQRYFWDYNLVYAANDEPLMTRLFEAAKGMVLFHGRSRYGVIGPIALLIVARRFLGAPRGWSRQTRILALVSAWWLAEVVSVAAPDRFYSHYWSLLIGPGAVLAAGAWTDLFARLGLNHPAVAAAAEPGIGGPFRTFHHLPLGLKMMFMPAVAILGLGAISALPAARAAVTFTGVEQHEQTMQANLPSGLDSVRAIVNATTGPEEQIFGWTSNAQLFVALDRPSATRFDRRNWLTGVVNNSDVIAEIPGVWDDLLADLAESQPRLVVEVMDVPIEPTSDLGRWLADDYDVLYDSLETFPVRVHQRNDAASIEDAAPRALAFATQECWQLPGWDTGSIDIAGDVQQGTMQFGGGLVQALRGPTAQAWTDGLYAQTAVPENDQRIEHLTLRVGDTAAILWAGEEILAALHLPHGITGVTFSDDLAPARCS